MPACSPAGGWALAPVKESMLISPAPWASWPSKAKIGCSILVRPPRTEPTLTMLLSAAGWVWFGKGEFGGLGVPEITGVQGAVAPDGAVAVTRHFYILSSASAAAFGRAAAAARQLPPRATRGADVTGPGAALVDAAVRTFSWRFCAECAADRRGSAVGAGQACRSVDAGSQTASSLTLAEAAGLVKASSRSADDRGYVVQMDVALSAGPSWDAELVADEGLKAGEEVTVTTADEQVVPAARGGRTTVRGGKSRTTKTPLHALARLLGSESVQECKALCDQEDPGCMECAEVLQEALGAVATEDDPGHGLLQFWETRNETVKLSSHSVRKVSLPTYILVSHNRAESEVLR